ncbi:MAG: DNA repair protein RecO C-terminal domain-containing protein [Bacteroidales bacterium]|nr:DNA repair protein RecO C-terminal domain-containing protein [Bacteroidales bacterium]
MLPERESRIIVLHLTKYGDSSLIVHALQKGGGRTGFFLRARGGKSGTGPFHSLGIADIVTARSKGNLPFIREALPAHHLLSIRTDPYKSAIAIFIGELLYRCITEEKIDDELFCFIEDEICRLESLASPCANFHLCFMVGLCRVMGFLPKDNYSARQPYFGIENAEFAAEPAAGSFSGECSRILHQLLSLSVEEGMKIPLSGALRGEFARKMVEFLCYHLSIKVRIKSLDVLHDIMS